MPLLNREQAAAKIQAVKRGAAARVDHAKTKVAERVEHRKEQLSSAKVAVKERVTGKTEAPPPPEAETVEPSEAEAVEPPPPAAPTPTDPQRLIADIEASAAAAAAQLYEAEPFEVVVYLNLIVVNAEVVAKDKVTETISSKVASKAPRFLPAARGKGVAALAGKVAGKVVAKKAAGKIASKIGEQLATEVPAMIGESAGIDMDAAVALEWGPSAEGVRLVVIKACLRGFDLERLLAKVGGTFERVGAKALELASGKVRAAAEKLLCEKAAGKIAMNLEKELPARLFAKAGLEVYVDAADEASQAARLLEIVQEFGLPGAPPAAAAKDDDEGDGPPAPVPPMGPGLAPLLAEKQLGASEKKLTQAFDATRDAEPETPPGEASCASRLRGLATNFIQAFTLASITGCAQPLIVIGRKVLEKVSAKSFQKRVAAECGGFALRVEPIRAEGLTHLRTDRAGNPVPIPMSPYVHAQLLCRGVAPSNPSYVGHTDAFIGGGTELAFAAGTSVALAFPIWRRQTLSSGLWVEVRDQPDAPLVSAALRREQLVGCGLVELGPLAAAAREQWAAVAGKRQWSSAAELTTQEINVQLYAPGAASHTRHTGPTRTAGAPAGMVRLRVAVLAAPPDAAAATEPKHDIAE